MADFGLSLGAVALCAFHLASPAQTPSPAPSAPHDKVPGDVTPSVDTVPGPPPTPPQGQVIIQSHGDPPPAPGEPGYPATGSASAVSPQQPVGDQTATADISDAERSALLITAYDLDARLTPARSGLSVRAQITVRNTGAQPLTHLALQISSTLRWESATLVEGGTRTHLALAQHTLDTDADHTGAESEAILPLPAPLAVGASASLDVFYSGTIVQSSGRLKRLGAEATQAQSADWDAISSSWTGLRGFGNVLWYPVASPQLFLQEGNTLFAAVGQARLRGEYAAMHLRLSVEYSGEPPTAAYFSGRRADLLAVSDAPDTAIAAGSGVARAEFASEPLGFRTPSLFLLALPESFPGATGESSADDAVGSSSSSMHASTDTSAAGTGAGTAATRPRPAVPALTGPPFLAVESADPAAAESFAAAASHVAPLLREWLGPQPLSALTAIDHNGQPYQDGPLLVAPLALLGASTENAALAQSLTYAWVQTGQPWMDEGLGQFFALLWTEREGGRAAANAALDELMRPVALAEPEPAAGPGAGQPLTEAPDDLFYRRKAGAVWWMLRGIVGDGNLHGALSAWRVQPISTASAREQAVAFQHLLEKLSGTDLGWFFNDWVLRDRGLPDLTITDVAAAQEPVAPGRPGGWLVAVTVRNEGGAVADVPMVVHSGIQHVEQRLRVAALSSTTLRIRTENTPTSVDVNDGGTPEVRTSMHTRDIKLQVR